MAIPPADMTAEYNWCRWLSLSPVVLGVWVILDVLDITRGGMARWIQSDGWATTGALVLIAGGILLFYSKRLWSGRSIRIYVMAALMSVALEMYLRFLAPTPPTGQGDGPVTWALHRLTCPGGYLTGYLLPHEYATIDYDERLVFVGFARERLVWPLHIHFNALFWALTSVILIFVYRSVRRQTPITPTI